MQIVFRYFKQFFRRERQLRAFCRRLQIGTRLLELSRSRFVGDARE